MTAPLRIHKNLLCQASPGLKKKIEKASVAEARPLTIMFFAREATVEVFRRWLYGEPAYQRDALQSLVDEMHVLMKAHKMGAQQSIDSSFQNTVIDAIIKLLIEHSHRLAIGRVIPKSRDFLREMTPQVQRLLADWVAYGEIDETNSSVDQLPRESGMQRVVLEAFFKRKISGSPQAPYVTSPSKYHVH